MLFRSLHGHVLMVILSRGDIVNNAFQGKSKLLVSAVAALFAVVTYTAYADDAVKAGGASDKPGRTIDDGVKSKGMSDKPGRAVDEGTVGSQGAATKPGRAVDQDVVKSNPSKAAKKQARAIDDVKAGVKPPTRKAVRWTKAQSNKA